jgi:DNA-binding MarR family transcriptional regulator
MEEILIDFINTLDISLKKYQAKTGEGSGVSSLTIHQFQYIDAIHALGEPSFTELAGKMKITKASVTTGINRLCELGFVKKTQSTEDKRVFHLSLTAQGRQMIKAKDRALKDYGEFILSALSDEEARQFETTLRKLVKLFNQA